MSPEDSPSTEKAPNPQTPVLGRLDSSSFTIQWRKGLIWAFLSPLFLGSIPIFAKLAYSAGVDVLTVVALRTTLASAILWFFALAFGRQFFRSSVPAVVGSMVAGAVNGVGSIFFYTSLTLISASLGQLINITYLIFVTLLLRLAGQAISILTLGRMVLAIAAVYLLTVGALGPPNWLGVGLMLVAAFSYAIQIVMSQRIMYDIPAPTMTLYAIAAMAMVVNFAWLFFRPTAVRLAPAGWQAILLMGAATALSRLTLFLGIKHLGSIQTALLGVLEVVVTITLAITLLDEALSALQWLGAGMLLLSVYMVRYEKGVPRLFDFWALVMRLRNQSRK